MHQDSSTSVARGSASDIPFLSRVPTNLVLFVLLGLCALVGNTMTLPLFFGFDYLFGSIPAFLALYWLGPAAGLSVAALGGSATWLLWGHPYAMVVLIAEIAVVGLLRQRAECANRRPLAFAAADALFWLALGMPLVLILYHFTLGLEWLPTWLIALKWALNGLINAAFAGLIVLAVAWLKNQRRAITFDRILFNILVLSLLLPALALSVWQSQDLVQALETGAASASEGSALLARPEGIGGRLGEQQLVEIEPDSSLDLDSLTAPLLDYAQQRVLEIFLALLALALFAIAIAAWLSTWLMRPLQQLVESTQQLPAAIAGPLPLPRLSSTPIRETDELAETIAGMARSLRASFQKLEHDKRCQNRQQSLAVLQASLLAELIDQQGDEASFAESLCSELEGVLPGYVCVLIRQTTTGELKLLRRTRKTVDGIDLTRLSVDAQLTACYEEVLEREEARPLQAIDISSVANADAPAQPETAQRETAKVAGWVLPIVGHSTVLIAIEQQPSTAEPTATEASFVREALEVGASLAGVAFEALQLRYRHQVLIEALSQAQTGVIITERTQDDDLITYVNSGFEAMTGYSAAEVIGRNCRFLQGPERAQVARREMRVALQDGDACSVIVRNYRKDGSYFWNSLYLSPMRDHEGRVSHYIGVQQDVTDAVETLERLRRNEAQLQEAQAMAHVGSWELDLGSGQAQWSDEAFRLFGFEPGAVQAAHETFLGIVSDEDRERVRETIATLDQRPSDAIELEHGVLGPDAVARTLLQQGRVYRNDRGEAVRLVGTCLDVTELRRSEATLRQQEERYRLVVENVEELILRINVQGRFEFVSPSFCQTFGYREEELIGHSLLPLAQIGGQVGSQIGGLSEGQTGQQPHSSRKAVAETSQLLLTPPFANDIDQHVQTVDGWRWLQWSSTAIRDAQGEVVAVVGVGRDITERKQAAAALAEREAMVSELLTLATGFVSVSDESSDLSTELALERVGEFMQADRCYLFCFSGDGRKVEKILERTAVDVAPIHDYYRGLSTDELPMMLAQLAVGEPVLIGDVTEFGASRWVSQRRRAETQPVRSLLLVPLQLDGRLFGFVGAEMVRGPRHWSTVDTQFLQLFANILVASEQRMRSLQALRQSNARYDNLARESRTIAWELDAQGQLTYISDVCEAVLGYPPATMIGQHCSQFIAEPEAGGGSAKVADLMAQHQPIDDLIMPFRSRDEELLWLAIDGTPMFSEDGQLRGYRGVTRDVSERQRALQRLAHSEARLSAIFDHSPLGIALVGQDRRPLLVNQALAQFLGTKADVLTQMRLDEFTHPNDLRQTLEAFEDLFAARSPSHRFTSRYLRSDGGHVWGDLRLSLLSASLESEPLALAILENVTELYDARDRQRAAEQELADYAEQLEYMIDVVNLSQPYSEQIESLLRLARRTLRVDTASVWLLGDSVADCLLMQVPDDGDNGLRGLPQVLRVKAAEELGSPVLVSESEARGGRIASTKDPVMIGLMLDSLTPDGHPERLLLTLNGGAAIHELDLGRSQLLRMIAQRIAAVRYRQHLQEDLVQARERETIGHLASGVSHDFNNLLGVIDANLFFISSAWQEQGSADDEVQQVIAETLSALGQAKVLTSGMLTMSGSGKISLERLDVADTVSELAQIIEQVLPARIRLELDLESGLEAYSNRAFLQSALLNLTLNGRDAIHAQGTVTIGARPLHWDASSTLVIGELPPVTDCVEIRVCDTGVGISPDLVGKIFRPLFTTKTKSRGHGFGLFMVREFVSRTQAGLKVDSEPGVGSCFRLLLPTEIPAEIPTEIAPTSEPLEEQAALLAEAEQLAQESAPPPQARPLAREAEPVSGADVSGADSSGMELSEGQESTREVLNILLVEDDRRVRDALSRVLRADGIQVETAEHGEAALERLARMSTLVDLVLSDIAMPVMDGLELHARLLEQYPQLPVILMTGQQAHWDPPLNQRDEPTLILRKPIDLGVLRQAMQERI